MSKINHYISVKRWGIEIYTHSIDKKTYRDTYSGKKRVIEVDNVTLHIIIPDSIEPELGMAVVNRDAAGWVVVLNREAAKKK